MTNEVKISDVLVSAFCVVESRGGDVNTYDGDVATCGVDAILSLDYNLAALLGLDSDSCESNHAIDVLMKAKEIDNIISQRDKLVELVEAAFIEGCLAGYSDGLSDGQCYSSNKSTSQPELDWECSFSSKLLNGILGEK